MSESEFELLILKVPPIMLHELLVSLLGYTGDLIIDETETESEREREQLWLSKPTFKLASDLSFLQPSQRFQHFSLYLSLLL